MIEIRHLALFVLAAFTRLMLVGRKRRSDGSHHIWWNFVSSSEQGIK